MTGPQLSIVFDTYFMYNYMSQLETGHPRMPRKADLLWYLIFVGGVIMVGLSSPLLSRAPSLCLVYVSCLVKRQSSYICPDSVSASTAITVPGTEEDYPCTSAVPSFAKLGSAAVWAWWDVFMDGSCDFPFTRVVLKLPTFLFHSLDICDAFPPSSRNVIL